MRPKRSGVTGESQWACVPMIESVPVRCVRNRIMQGRICKPASSGGSMPKTMGHFTFLLICKPRADTCDTREWGKGFGRVAKDLPGPVPVYTLPATRAGCMCQAVAWRRRFWVRWCLRHRHLGLGLGAHEGRRRRGVEGRAACRDWRSSGWNPRQRCKWVAEAGTSRIGLLCILCTKDDPTLLL
jgi:hypothetical protein